MVLALVLLAVHRPTASAVAISCAALMKATAWPLWVLLLAWHVSSARHGRERHGRGWVFAATPAVLAVTAVWDGPGMVGDTLLYPLGLVGRVPTDSTPDWAALVAAADPSERGAPVTVLLVLGVAAAGATCVVRARPSVAAVAVLAAGVTATALLALPSARPGLWLYPVALAVGCMLLPGSSSQHGGEGDVIANRRDTPPTQGACRGTDADPAGPLTVSPRGSG
jgi:hypothetical protein